MGFTVAALNTMGNSATREELINATKKDIRFKDEEEKDEKNQV